MAIVWLYGVFFSFWYVVARKIWQPWLRCHEKPDFKT
jgi:hypothetical protein